MLKAILFSLTMFVLLTWVASLAFAVVPCEPPGELKNGVCVFPDEGGTGGGNNIEPTLPESPAKNFGPDAGATLVGDLISKILPIAIALGGFLTVIFIIISGIQFITSSGNPEAANAARNRLTFAIIGFVVLALSFLIVQFINNVFLGSEDFSSQIINLLT